MPDHSEPPPSARVALPLDAGARVIDLEGLDRLISRLGDDGYDVIGPTRRDEAIVYDHIEGISDLPIGWTDEQDAGRYRLRRRDDQKVFGYAVGPHSWKRFLFPSRTTLVNATRDEAGGILVDLPRRPGDAEHGPGESPLTELPDWTGVGRYALFGVRSCELHALRIHDRVLIGGGHPDPEYAQHRRGAFVVAVNCGDPGGTCFCVSMATGPSVDSATVNGGAPAYDIALTELVPGHEFLAVAGSDDGSVLVETLPGRPAVAHDATRAAAIVAEAADHMGRHLDTEGLHDLLVGRPDHPAWAAVADRCLSCTNCTMVCPTCFCTSVEDTTDLTGEHAERWRRWDSCFTLDFSYVHGGSVRPTTEGRYRQWLTHKLATWIDQFGESGCVGCGRCITWCPVGIDITDEVEALRADPHDGLESTHVPTDRHGGAS